MEETSTLVKTPKEGLLVSTLYVTLFFQINNDLLVEVFKHNLFSISQLCDKVFKISFYSLCSEIIDASTNEIA